MSPVIPMKADPALTSEVVNLVYGRVKSLRESGATGVPVEISVREATILTARMNDINAGSDRGLAFEPEIGDEGTVFGYPFVVARRHARE